VLRLLVFAVLAFTALTLGAMAAIYLVTSADPAVAVAVAPGGPGGAAQAPASAPPIVLPAAPGPGAPQAPPPAAQVTVGAPPPAVAAAPEERTAQLLAFREVRRGDAMDQLNAREALRRQRLGLPPPAPAPGSQNPAVHAGAQARSHR
jgi:hypothetical protein